MDIFRYLCHRRPERSFFYRGHQFPVCSRCTGLIVGSFSFFIYMVIFDVGNGSFNMFLVSLLLQIPYVIDGTTQALGLRESNNYLRFVTGFLGGMGIVLFARYVRVLFDGLLTLMVVL